MRGTLILALVAVTGLSACLAGGGTVPVTPEAQARELARFAVDGAVKSRLPGADVSAYTDCVIDHASMDELFVLASAGGSGVLGDTASATSQAWPVIRSIIGRPEAVQCLTGAALSGQGLAGLLQQ